MRRAPNPILVTASLSVVALAVYFAVRALSPRRVDDGTPPPIEPPALVESLPEFVFDDLAGTPTASTSWPDRPVVFNFWATWCAPCLREIPMLKAFQTEHPDIQVVGIAIDREAAVRAFAEDAGFNYPVLVGPTTMDAAAAFGVGYVALPLTVFVDDSAAVLGAHLGELHPEHLANFTATLAGLDGGDLDLAQARARIARRR